MPSNATWHRNALNADLELRLLVVHCDGSLTPASLSSLSEITKFLMSAALPGAQGAMPSVHVLIVVVGRYLLESRNLTGAGAVTQEIVDFWRHDDRVFANPGRSGSIEVLASDPDQQNLTIATASGSIVPLDPTSKQVADSLIAWTDRLTRDEGSIGVLHWIGHGHDHAQQGGTIANLLCHGPDQLNPDAQSGIEWTAWLHVINGRTIDRQVYCFIDACREDPQVNESFERPPGRVRWNISNHVQVFTSTAYGKPAHWINQVNDAAANAGCGNGPVGTRAFLAALGHYGAKWDAALPMPIVSEEILRASRALVQRWIDHQGLNSGLPEGPSAPLEDAMLMTRWPKSLVDVKSASTPPHPCEAQPSAKAGTPVNIEPAETVVAPHQFRLAREPHRFRLDGSNWGPSKQLVYPHVSI